MDDANFSENTKQADDAQRLKAPPFVVGSWAALAFVEGTYNPPSRKATEAHPDDFLGIYLSKEDSGVGLITFTGAGKYVAFHRCGEPDSPAEFAVIDAFIHYEIPFEQWRPYPLSSTEADTLNAMGLRDDYAKALRGLSNVLYQARINIQPGRSRLDPMFLLAARTKEAIAEDEFTADAIRRSLLGEERAARYLRIRGKRDTHTSQPTNEDLTSE